MALSKPVTHLPQLTLRELVYELTGANVCGRDWRGLGCYIGFTSNHIRLIEQDQRPEKAYLLLDAWDRTRQSSIRLLVIALEQLGYVSSVRILKESEELKGQIDWDAITDEIQQLKAEGGDSHVQKSLFPRFKETDVILWPDVISKAPEMSSLPAKPPQQCNLTCSQPRSPQCLPEFPQQCGPPHSQSLPAKPPQQCDPQSPPSTPPPAKKPLQCSPPPEYHSRCVTEAVQHMGQPGARDLTQPTLMPKTVFISYYPESKKHKQEVAALVQQLRAQGFAVFFDELCKKDIKKKGGLTRWKEQCIAVAENIVVVCSPKYYREDLELSNSCSQPKLSKLKVAVDTSLLRNLAYTGGCSRLIPVVMGRDDPNACTPIWLQSVMLHHWPSQREDLMYFIAGVPKFKMPPVVERIVLKPKVIDFPEAYDWDPYDVEPPQSL